MSSEPADRHERPSVPYRQGSNAEDRVTLLATVQHSSDRPDECTIYPAAVDPARRTTTWITAIEGSFLALQDCR